MAGFSAGSLMFAVCAFVGLILLTVGIIFLMKNIRWKKEKDARGEKTTSNIVAIVIFGLMIFFGGVWLLCFGAGAVIFGLLGVVL